MALNKAFLNAVNCGEVDIARIFLSRGADVHYDSNKALIDASSRRSPERFPMLRLLVRAGADIHAFDDKSLRNVCCSAVYDAKESDESVLTLQVMLDAGANVHANNDESLINAVEKGAARTVELLLKCGANIHAQNDCCLFKSFHSATSYTPSYYINEPQRDDFLNVFRLVLAHHIDYNHEYVEKLCECLPARIRMVRSDNTPAVIEIIQLLLDFAQDNSLCIDIQEFKNKILVSGVISGDKRIIEYLLDQGADVQCYDNEPLFQCVQSTLPENIALLLDRGADIHSRNDYALFHTLNVFKQIQWNYHTSKVINVLTVLLERGANISLYSQEANELIICLRYDMRLIKLMLDYGLVVCGENISKIRELFENPNLNQIPNDILLVAPYASFFYKNIQDYAFIPRFFKIMGLLRRHVHRLEELARRQICKRIEPREFTIGARRQICKRIDPIEFTIGAIGDILLKFDKIVAIEHL
jgi:ankyrin repeat protein